jgi:uncharacterized protein (TIGR03000 family)
MYSMVLMAALTTGGEAPDCWFRCGGSHSCAGCYGCAGCAGGYGCAAGYGCAGCYGCTGYFGGGYQYGPGYFNSYSCHGCWGCGGYYGYVGSTYMPTTPMPPAGGTDKSGDKKDKDKESRLPTRAKLIVELPTDAKLFIDDQLMKSTATTRSFNTPALEVGTSYYYDLRVEVVRDGKTYEGTKRVVIRAGEQVRAAFTESEADSASSGSVLVKLMPGR